MTLNPYHPPEHAAQQRADTTGATVPRPRPISAWILGILLVLVALLAFVGLARTFFAIATHLDAVTFRWPLVWAIVWRLATAVLFVVTSIGIFRRRVWARWVGALTIVGFTVFALLQPDAMTYTNDAQRTGGMIGRYVVAPLLLAWWIYAFAFSVKARRYYGGDA